MSSGAPRPNLANLDIATLKRYKKFYRLNCEDDKSKLVAAVSRHFQTLVLDEAKVLSRFADSVKRRKLTYLQGTTGQPVRK